MYGWVQIEGLREQKNYGTKLKNMIKYTIVEINLVRLAIDYLLICNLVSYSKWQ